MNEEQTNFDYWRELWREKTPEGRRRYVILLVIYLCLLLVGSYLAATEMAAVMAIKMPERILAAVMVGPFGVVWAVLEETGHIVENPGQPGPGWVLAFLAHLGAWVAAGYFGMQPVNQANLNKRAIAQHQERQGQLPAEEAAELLPIQVGVPYVTVKDKAQKRATVGLDYARGQGHVLVTAPTRGGKVRRVTAQ